MKGDERGETTGMESFTLTVLVLFLVGATAVVRILQDTIATVGLTSTEGLAAGFLSLSILVVILLYSTGPVRR